MSKNANKSKPDNSKKGKAENEEKDEVVIYRHPVDSPFYETSEALIEASNGKYFVNGHNTMCNYNGDKITALCGGAFRMISETIRKGGSEEPEIYFEIECTLRTGEKRIVTVAAQDLSSTDWIVKSCGSGIVLSPASNVMRYIQEAILLTGGMAEKKTELACTGYVNQNGVPIDWVDSNGGLLNPNLRVSLPKVLGNYALSGLSHTDEEKIEAIRASLSTLEAHVSEVAYPMFAYIYLHPAIPLLKKCVGEVGFCVNLQGKSQSGKTTTLRVFLSHFGNFIDNKLPGSSISTKLALAELSYITKDLPSTVDDLGFGQTQAEINEHQAIAQYIARAADGATRERLGRDSKLQDSKPARSTFALTSEQLGNIGLSAKNRIYTIETPKARKDITKIMEYARSGVLSRAMADYIAYVIENYEELLGRTKAAYEKILSRSNEIFGECRLSNQSTLLMLSSVLYFDYVVTSGALSQEEASKMCLSIEKTIVAVAKKQADSLVLEDPCEQFVNAIRDLNANGRISFLELPCPSHTSLNQREGIIGWKDDKGYYLDSQAGYAQVLDYYRNQNMVFVISPNTLWKQLRDSKKLIPDKSNNPQVQKRIGSLNRRVLWFPRCVFDSNENEGDM